MVSVSMEFGAEFPGIRFLVAVLDRNAGTRWVSISIHGFWGRISRDTILDTDLDRNAKGFNIHVICERLSREPTIVRDLDLNVGTLETSNNSEFRATYAGRR